MAEIAGLLGIVAGGIIATVVLSIPLSKWLTTFGKSVAILFLSAAGLRLLVWLVLDSMQLEKAPEILTFISYLLGALMISYLRKSRKSESGQEKQINLLPNSLRAKWIEIRNYLTRSSDTYVPKKFELIGFRAMLLAVGIGSAALLFSCYSYIMFQNSWDLIKATAGEQIKCETQLRPSILACQLTDDRAYDTCLSVLKSRCSNYQMEWLEIERDKWDDRNEFTLHLGLILLGVSTFAFYSLRWVILGRLRPYWPK